MTFIALVFSLLAGSGVLAWAYTQAGLDSAARGLLVLAFCWLVAEWRRWRWFSAFGLFSFIGFAAYGLWIGLPAALMVIGALGALFTWDLGDFLKRLRLAASAEDAPGMELRHLARLLIVAVLGLSLAGLTAVLRVRLTFEVVVGLVLVTAFGLAQLFRWLQGGNG